MNFWGWMSGTSYGQLTQTRCEAIVQGRHSSGGKVVIPIRPVGGRMTAPVPILGTVLMTSSNLRQGGPCRSVPTPRKALLTGRGVCGVLPADHGGGMAPKLSILLQRLEDKLSLAVVTGGQQLGFLSLADASQFPGPPF